MHDVALQMFLFLGSWPVWNNQSSSRRKSRSILSGYFKKLCFTGNI